MNDFLSELLKLGRKVVDASEAIQAENDKHSKPRETPDVASAASGPVIERSKDAAEATVTGSSTTDNKDSPKYSQLYVKHLVGGCPDPLSLLTVAQAQQFMECEIATPVTTGEAEYIGCHYGCADDRSMYVSISVSAEMPWDYVQEVTSAASVSIGDEARVAQDMMYVKSGDHFFWIYGRGISEATIHRIAEHVANELAK